MRIFGLIGNSLKHSYSEKFFTEKFRQEKINDARYFLFPMSNIDEYRTLVQRYQFSGLQVTNPFKQSIMGYLEALDEEASMVGAVNTIKFIKDGTKIITKGYNTDIAGFDALLGNFSLPAGNSALILGTGGASKAVAYILKKKEIPFHFVSRSPVDAEIFSYDSLTAKVVSENRLIINATPAGLYPDIESFPGIPYEAVSKNHICIDLIYNPDKTVFMQKCEQMEAQVVNGLEMLWVQAEKSWEIWNQ
ncbi:MAG TPA: shikimate dehydrogenase [Bacteroidales bacterium]|nr:shikimate dehydrogenase [Bacteroidales bacterium]HQI71458.1 shikimate dehydrogenase [Bacteroidales bacterium]